MKNLKTWSRRARWCRCGHGKTIHIKVPGEPRFACHFGACKCKNYRPADDDAAQKDSKST